jgi:hypothetical protein
MLIANVSIRCDPSTLRMSQCHIHCYVSVNDDSTFLENIFVDSHLLSIIERHFLQCFYRLTISVIAGSQQIFISTDETFVKYYQWTNLIVTLS